MTKDNKVTKRRFQGVVVSDKMDKTIVVKVNRVRVHAIYKKRYTTSKKYKVHDEANRYKTGDVVDFMECRPLSKDKKWRVIYPGDKEKQ
ncbi:MAG: 30S ribosomal protein S17 [bacterium]|nr:30S ribosomal protein S17 [bacterium]